MTFGLRAFELRLGISSTWPFVSVTGSGGRRLPRRKWNRLRQRPRLRTKRTRKARSTRGGTSAITRPHPATCARCAETYTGHDRSEESPSLPLPYARNSRRRSGDMWSELVIGSNRLIDASGVIVVMGKEQVHLERGRDDQLLLTMDLYDAEGTHIAKLRRNAWAFHGEDYDITTHPSSLSLVHRASGTLVAEAQVQDRDRIVVP